MKFRITATAVFVIAYCVALAIFTRTPITYTSGKYLDVSPQVLVNNSTSNEAFESLPVSTVAPPLPILSCNTSKGVFSVLIHTELCPRSARQLVLMLELGFLNQGISFWRVNKWITQFGADKSPTARQKRGEIDPFANIRKGLGNDPHPACRAFNMTRKACKHDSSPEVKTARQASPWKRGTFAVIGSTTLLVVIDPNSNMGVAAHDCPMGTVLTNTSSPRAPKEGGDGMSGVFDRLYSGYGNVIDTKGRGPDQRDIFREGLGFMNREYPLTDVLYRCAMNKAAAHAVLEETAACCSAKEEN
mmetsp:Transcript_56012/g.96435  ORF Transcript_56012/g.96435 Transcript_56012/m.96435 type:complete len:302 (+) Transcript_56012:100-1005(+)